MARARKRNPCCTFLACAAFFASPAHAEPLKLEAGKPLEITCETKAFVVATDAANATAGEIRLKLEITDAKANLQTGTWTPISAGESHNGSFVLGQKEACAKGCPLQLTAAGEPQLWAPAPKGIDKLTENELLVLAVIRAEKNEIKVSTFRGQAIEALEEGTCKGAS